MLSASIAVSSWGCDGSVVKAPQVLYVADSHSGGIYAFRIDSGTGELTALPGSPYAAGLNTALQIAETPSGAFLFAAEWDQSYVDVYSISKKTGELTRLTDPGSERQPAQLKHTGLGFKPSLAVIPSQHLLYAISTDSYDFTSGTYTGGIFGFTYDDTGVFTPVTGSPFSIGSPPMWPVSISTNREGKFLYAGDVWSGNIYGWAIGSDGSLTPLANSPFGAAGQCCNPLLQWSRELLYADYVEGGVPAFRVDPSTGELVADDQATLSIGGPGQIAFDRAGVFAFSTSTGYGTYPYPDTNGRIYVVLLRGPSGAPEAVKDSPVTAEPGANFLSVDTYGTFLYVSNLGPRDQNGMSLYSGSLSAYAINHATGSLRALRSSPMALGAAPESLAIVTLQ